MIIARHATVEDIPALFELGRELQAESEAYVGLTPDYRKQYAVVTKLLSDPRRCVLIASDGSGLLLAGIMEELWYEHHYSIDYMTFVRKSARGSGVWEALVEAYEEWARVSGITDVRLSFTNLSEPAEKLALYEGMGYELFNVITRKEL